MPPPAKRGGWHSAHTMDFIGDLTGWSRRGARAWALRGHTTGTSAAGWGKLRHSRAHACPLPGVLSHTHTQSKAPPTQPRAPRVPLPIPAPWGTSTVPRKGVLVSGWEPIGVASGLLPPESPHSLAMQGGGSQSHTRHPTAGRGNGCCTQWRLAGDAGEVQEQGLSGCWGTSRCGAGRL